MPRSGRVRREQTAPRHYKTSGVTQIDADNDISVTYGNYVPTNLRNPRFTEPTTIYVHANACSSKGPWGGSGRSAATDHPETGEQTFALLHQFRRLAIRWERRLDIHDALVSLDCVLICWRRLINWPRQRSRQELY